MATASYNHHVKKKHGRTVWTRFRIILQGVLGRRTSVKFQRSRDPEVVSFMTETLRDILRRCDELNNRLETLQRTYEEAEARSTPEVVGEIASGDRNSVDKQNFKEDKDGDKEEDEGTEDRGGENPGGIESSGPTRGTVPVSFPEESLQAVHGVSTDSSANSRTRLMRQEMKTVLHKALVTLMDKRIGYLDKVQLMRRALGAGDFPSAASELVLQDCALDRFLQNVPCGAQHSSGTSERNRCNCGIVKYTQVVDSRDTMADMVSMFSMDTLDDRHAAGQCRSQQSADWSARSVLTSHSVPAFVTDGPTFATATYTQNRRSASADKLVEMSSRSRYSLGCLPGISRSGYKALALVRDAVSSSQFTTILSMAGDESTITGICRPCLRQFKRTCNEIERNSGSSCRRRSYSWCSKCARESCSSVCGEYSCTSECRCRGQ